MNEYARTADDMPRGVGWRFLPKKKGGKLTAKDILCELFDRGMEQSVYAQLYRVPDEFPEALPEHVDLYEPENAIALLCQYIRAKGRVMDESGNVIWESEDFLSEGPIAMSETTKTVTEWRSVTDELPPEGVEVMTWNGVYCDFVEWHGKVRGWNISGGEDITMWAYEPKPTGVDERGAD